MEYWTNVLFAKHLKSRPINPNITKSKSKSYDLLRMEIHIEHKIFCQLKHDQDWSVNLLSGSRPGRLLLDPFNINNIVIRTSFHNTK